MRSPLLSFALAFLIITGVSHKTAEASHLDPAYAACIDTAQQNRDVRLDGVRDTRDSARASFRSANDSYRQARRDANEAYRQAKENCGRNGIIRGEPRTPSRDTSKVRADCRPYPCGVPRCFDGIPINYFRYPC